ncbi:MAG: Flp pilus assembly complex ATPase component TadA [Methylococcales bacterium]|nr:Flp pilus assembly complex ATPase component TadA [Methylococcales bacterium]
MTTSKSGFSLASWNSTPNKEQDQRNQQRIKTINHEATIFAEDIISLSCTVSDMSKAGAMLVANTPNLTIEQDVPLTVSIQSAGKKLTRNAIVRWVIISNDEMRFGVQYVDHVKLEPATHQLDIEQVKIDPACTLRIPSSLAVRRKVLPFLEQQGVIHVACCNVNNISMVNTIERMIKAPVVLWNVEQEKLEKVLKQVYGNSQPAPILPGKASANDEKTSDAVDLGDKLLYAAYIREASDIHIDPTHKGARIRFRVDGQLETYDSIQQDIYTELASRIKVMANLDIAEKRAPQDGRFSHQFVSGGKRIDMRVATLPTKYGERITMRLLAVNTEGLTLNKLGFTDNNRTMIERFLRRTQGLMIMTGPTGSGKTTTLYASIRLLLAERDVNIITVEDPIEYEINGVAQCEIDPASDKLDFAKALRSILRHDPDVVMLGEIRDKETADIAIKAALTGHMVLGTLHTNSAAATVTRLIDMGVQPYLIAAALRLAVAQRLLRRLCTHCRISRPLTEQEAISIFHPELTGTQVYDPTGCVYCGDKGYAGRIGLYEILELNESWARDVADEKGEAVLTDNMRKSGVHSLLDDAIEKLVSGQTSFSEVLQIASSW